jgi:hypothetical protein
MLRLTPYANAAEYRPASARVLVSEPVSFREITRFHSFGAPGRAAAFKE